MTDQYKAHISPGPRHRRDENYPRSENGRRSSLIVQLYAAANSSCPNTTNFPMHMPCLELLCRNLTPLASPFANSQLNKDALYFTLLTLCDYNPQALMISYGAAESSQERNWVCRSGYEWVVAHPGINTDSRAVYSLLRNRLALPRPRLFVKEDLSAKVRSDPFQNLPYDLLYRLSGLLSDRDLFALCTASWPMHLLLRNNYKFWRYRVTKVSMPWFKEALTVLAEQKTTEEWKTREKNEHGFHERNWKGVLSTLNELLVSDEGKSGVLMGIKNRRRIWDMCRVIGQTYRAVERELRKKGSGGLMEEFK